MPFTTLDTSGSLTLEHLESLRRALEVDNYSMDHRLDSMAYASRHLHVHPEPRPTNLTSEPGERVIIGHRHDLWSFRATEGFYSHPQPIDNREPESLQDPVSWMADLITNFHKESA